MFVLAQAKSSRDRVKVFAGRQVYMKWVRATANRQPCKSVNGDHVYGRRVRSIIA